jgi:hypothetical protein
VLDVLGDGLDGAVRELAQRWVERFLDPFDGGLDGQGWPFKATVYAQDFARLVADIPEVRHVVDVALFEIGKDRRAESDVPGWEEGEGVDELFLVDADLFLVRRVRVQFEGAAE